jgi:IS30 family transposase
MPGGSIERRPADAAWREEAGHWEIDCAIERKSDKTAAMALVERKSRKADSGKAML